MCCVTPSQAETSLGTNEYTHLPKPSTLRSPGKTYTAYVLSVSSRASGQPFPGQGLSEVIPSWAQQAHRPYRSQKA